MLIEPDVSTAARRADIGTPGQTEECYWRNLEVSVGRSQSGSNGALDHWKSELVESASEERTETQEPSVFEHSEIGWCLSGRDASA